MSVELVSIIVLVGIFLIATLQPVHMGVLALAGAFVLGMFVLKGSTDDKVDQLFGGFPGDLFVILAGITLLFAIAKANGTIDWLVQGAVRSVGGRVALIPWVMFLITGLLTAVGAVVPGAVAIIAPIGLRFARRYGISPILMGLMIINGATAGGFSPISIFGTITNGTVERNNLEGSPIFLFLASLVFNFVLAIATYVMFGGRELIGMRDAGDGTLEGAGSGPAGAQRRSRLGRGPAAQTGSSPRATATRTPPDDDTETPEEVHSLDLNRALTIVGLVALVLGALFFDLDVGFGAFVVAAVLMLIDPETSKGAVGHIAWPTVLLVCGIVTYVSLMEALGTIDYLGEKVASLGAAMLAALLICFIGGLVSAFASTTGILGALIPLAVPFLQSDTSGIGAIGLVTALAISSSVVDSSPFSTSGALVLANAPDDQRDFVYRRLIQWGFAMVVVAPVVTWALLVVPGWT